MRLSKRCWRKRKEKKEADLKVSVRVYCIHIHRALFLFITTQKHPAEEMFLAMQPVGPIGQ